MLIWTERMDAKYSRRTKAIWKQMVKWDLCGRGFLILAFIVGGITRPVFSRGDWVAFGIVGALMLAAFGCVGVMAYHEVRFLRSCAVDRRRRKAGLPLDDTEPVGVPPTGTSGLPRG
ncbi:hypothetical protein [Sinomonas sp. G460-2]|uniref:hypothetical protein n=1 Tax=Sinomonas sp. G460-2 TaxID=3393464 RepID=UPI0039F04896